MKRLSATIQTSIEFELPDARGFYLTTDVSEEDQKKLHEGLHNHVISHIGDEYKGFSIKLILKDQEGNLAGGLLAWTTLQNLIFEHIWIEENYRRKGLGRKLMLEMERVAEEHGCIASQAYCFSFQALEFLKKLGYKTLGVSDGYPHPVKEYYLIKKYIHPPTTGSTTCEGHRTLRNTCQEVAASPDGSK